MQLSYVWHVYAVRHVYAVKVPHRAQHPAVNTVTVVIVLVSAVRIVYMLFS